MLILDSIADLLGGSVSVIQLLSLEISLTVVISFCAAMLIAKIPFLKKILIQLAKAAVTSFWSDSGSSQ